MTSRLSRKPVLVAALFLGIGGTWFGHDSIDGGLSDAGGLLRHYLGLTLPVTRTTLVVAVDSGVLASPELRATPRLMFGRVWGESVDALFAAGARAVVFDFIFAVSVDDWLRRERGLDAGGLDRGFLDALQRHGERVVLARTAALTPALPFRLALRANDEAARLGFAELTSDADGVVRRMPLAFTTTRGAQLPSLAGAALLAGGRILLDDAKGDVRPRVDGPLEQVIPTISLGDLRRCPAQTIAGSALGALVRDRIVVVGTTLPEEDRRRAGDRMTLGRRAAGGQDAAGPSSPPCAPRLLGQSAPASGTVPAAHLHAAAMAAVQDATTLAAAPFWLRATLGVAASSAAGLMARRLSPLLLAAWLAAGLVLLALAAMLAPLAFHWLPVSGTIAAALLLAGCVFAWRILVSERRERHVRRIFGHFLSPRRVADLVAADYMPELGGKTCEITVMFADLSGFTGRVERLEPQEAIGLANLDLGEIAAAVDASGGYVDKFMGDAVMALWNAPAALADHPRRALEAALAILSRPAGRDSLPLRIGLETGLAAVGHVGASGRLDYTAIGDPVNVAARLEPLGKRYGLPLLVGPELAGLIGLEAMVEIDRVTLAGRIGETAIYLPRAALAELDEGSIPAYGAALGLLRAGDAIAARAAFAALAADTGAGLLRGPAAVLAKAASGTGD